LSKQQIYDVWLRRVWKQHVGDDAVAGQSRERTEHRPTRTFDHFGNVVLSVDGRGETTYAYDLDNRLISSTDQDTIQPVTRTTPSAIRFRLPMPAITITRVYDRNNMLISTSDPSADAAKAHNTAFATTSSATARR
jgi:YD repeat-containing protein